MKALLTVGICLLALNGISQDTIGGGTQYDMADSIFGSLNALVPSGKLYNRLQLDDTEQSMAMNADQVGLDTLLPADADYMYGLLYEMKLMANDTSTVPGRLAVFGEVSIFMGEQEFELDEYYYPIGIIDYRFDYLDVNQNIQNGRITKNGIQYFPNSSQLELESHTARLAGPLFDMFDSDRMGLLFQRKHFYSNYRSVDDIASIELTYKGQAYLLQFDQLFYFNPGFRKINQTFSVKITYTDDSVLENVFVIHTPEKEFDEDEEKSSSFPGCDDDDVIDIEGDKLKWCLVGRCGYDGKVYKPYILITGYRPPIFGQKYKTTWKYYNDEHQSLLNSLRDNNYDIYLVKFNINARPNKHGMQESADLLEKFILMVNADKGGAASGQENIIQGSSMGEDIARLTLLRMEKKHLEGPTYPHHHTRLHIAYDANFYGGNIPLGYQCQIISAFHYPAALSGANVFKHFMSSFLFATMTQKTVEELLTYHAKAVDEDIFKYQNGVYTYATPTHHWRRQSYYDALAQVDNGVHIFPMPIYTRNIGISLGQISQTNNNNNEGFSAAGEYWRNINLGIWQYKIGLAKFMPSNQSFEIFKRRKSIGTHHELNVTGMQEIDNASGSYLQGQGNIINVANWTYFSIPNMFDGHDYFTHKSVITALGINRDFWPDNGSWTLDIQSLGLMNVDKLPSGILVPSNYYGYPNLSHPNTHFQITPFEAVYVDRKINPHIRLKDDDPADLSMLTNFILNEVEPWFLGLQNATIGAQARPDYRYHAYRRAENLIVVGHLVTPSTDPGDYVVNHNGQLTLKAGKEIDLKPGVHFKAGGIVHIVPEYQACSNSKSIETSDDYSEITNSPVMVSNSAPEVKNKFIVFPNPTDGVVEITGEATVIELTIFSLSGNEERKLQPNEQQFSINTTGMKSGVYFVRIRTLDHIETHKLRVL